MNENQRRRYWTVTFDFDGAEQIQIDVMAVRRICAIRRATDALDARDRNRRFTAEANEVLSNAD